MLTCSRLSNSLLSCFCVGIYPSELSIVLDIAAGEFTAGRCKLSLLQKDLKLAINMSDAVDQPLHVSSAVNEV